jgi:hypothetical protein
MVTECLEALDHLEKNIALGFQGLQAFDDR